MKKDGGFMGSTKSSGAGGQGGGGGRGYGPVGLIDTNAINETHKQIKSIVESYSSINKRVSDIKISLNDNWVGEGNTEFNSQYDMLISKIDDFGDTLKALYDALVRAEADYEDTDDDIRQDFVMTMKD